MKYLYSFISCILLCFLLIGCSKQKDNINVENVNKIKETIDDMTMGDEIFIKEDNGFQPYIVLTDDYNGETLLLRKYLLDTDRRMNEYYALYENCEMDVFLNEVFLKTIDKDIQSLICDSYIDVVDDGYFYNDVIIKQIKRKIFLLSFKELGLQEELDSIAGAEGKILKYFNNWDNSLTSKVGKEPSSWWLRSVETTYDSCFLGIGGDGKIGHGNAFQASGVRPAFCLPNNTPIIENKDILENQTVYVIKLQSINDCDIQINNTNTENTNIIKKTISDMAIGDEIFIKEDEGFRPYIILTHDYNDKTLLLRKYLLNENGGIGEYSLYENCEMDIFLNEVFLKTIDKKTQSLICDSYIDVVDDGFTHTETVIKIIKRKVFLLSLNELGLMQNKQFAGKEGIILNYFNNLENRIACMIGKEPSSWWLRSINTTYNGDFYMSGSEGQCESKYASCVKGVRPAFCIPNDVPINENIIPGIDEKIYTIK